MFQDPLIAVMAMLLLCFAGMMVMFVFVIRSLSGQADAQRESFRKQQLFLADLERQIIDLKIALRRLSGDDNEEDGQDSDDKDRDPLSILRQEDPLLSMLEAAAKPQSGPQAEKAAPRAERKAPAIRTGVPDDPFVRSLLGYEPASQEEGLLAAPSPAGPVNSPGAADSATAPDISEDSAQVLAEPLAMEFSPEDRPFPKNGTRPIAIVKFEDEALGWTEKELDGREPFPEQADNFFSGGRAGLHDDDDFSFKVFRKEERDGTPAGQAVSAQANKAPGNDARGSVDKLLEDVGSALSASEGFTHTRTGQGSGLFLSDPGDLPSRENPDASDPAEQRDERLPDLDERLTLDTAIPGSQGKTALADEVAGDLSSLGASYRALRNRAEKLFEEVSGAFFSGTRTESKDFDSGPPEDALKDSSSKPEITLFDMEAEAESGRTGSSFKNFQDMAATPPRPEPRGEDDGEAAGGILIAEESVEEIQAANGEKEKATIRDDGNGGDAIAEYASRFMADREQPPFAVKARHPSEKKNKSRRKALGKRSIPAPASDE